MAKVLVVDDDQVSHQILRILLRREDHDVYSATNGLEAIESVQNEWIDLVITDINMPEMDGLEFLRWLRANEQHKDIPVIVLTASGQLNLVEKANEQGATGFITQPFSSWELIGLVNECLENSTEFQQ
jgi:two-component system chemotaxis response regulator CheY